jgi:hypothetical protein
VSLIDNHLTLIQATLDANPDPNHDDYHAGLVTAMIPAIAIDTCKTIRPPVPAITDSENEPEITWPDLLEVRLIDSTGHEVIFDPVASEESRRFRSGIRPSTTSTPRRLRPAPSLEAGLALFPEPAPRSASLVCGTSIAAAPTPSPPPAHTSSRHDRGRPRHSQPMFRSVVRSVVWSLCAGSARGGGVRRGVGYGP